MELKAEYEWDDSGPYGLLFGGPHVGEQKHLASAGCEFWFVYDRTLPPETTQIVAESDCASAKDGKRQVENWMREAGWLVEKEPEVVWNRYADYYYVGKHWRVRHMSANRLGWVVWDTNGEHLLSRGSLDSVGLNQQAALDYCREHKLHMFAEPAIEAEVVPEPDESPWQVGQWYQGRHQRRRFTAFRLETLPDAHGWARAYFMDGEVSVHEVCSPSVAGSFTLLTDKEVAQLRKEHNDGSV